jgi:hypothetical protein
MNHTYYWKPGTLETGVLSDADIVSEASLKGVKEIGFIKVPFTLWRVINTMFRIKYGVRKNK